MNQKRKSYIALLAVVFHVCSVVLPAWLHHHDDLLPWDKFAVHEESSNTDQSKNIPNSLKHDCLICQISHNPFEHTTFTPFEFKTEHNEQLSSLVLSKPTTTLFPSISKRGPPSLI